jgi:redox-sensitive bicupin YhaK (pirin superfamily)
MSLVQQRCMTRKITRIVTAHRQMEGGGFIVRRPVPTEGLELVDPFLLVDEMGPIDYAPGQAVGAPDHPHRGFETVSYILEGELQHEDSAGNRGTLASGDVQWMTAGRGVVHAEMPSERMQRDGGRMHGFQVWVNLPASEKQTEPRYQELKAAKIPTATSADGLATVRVIAGEALGAKAAIDTRTPIVYQDWTLAEGGAPIVQPIANDDNALVYVFEGAALVGDDATVVNEGQMALFEGGKGPIRLATTTGARFLLLAGKPINEPVARYGPFVMNTAGEIMEALHDWRTGRIAGIARH